MAQMFFKWCVFSKTKKNGSKTCYRAIKKTLGYLKKSAYKSFSLHSDQVFKITPSNDEEVRTLREILGHMKVGTLFCFMYTFYIHS